MATKTEQPKKKQSTPDAVEEGKPAFNLSRLNEFAGEVKAEFEKIVWPDKKVTMGSTGIVIILVTIISLYLGAVDLFLGKLVSQIIK